MIETLLEVRNLSKTFRYRTGWFRRQTVEAVKPLSFTLREGQLISHDLQMLSQWADKINVLYCGQTVETAPSKELVTMPHHPYTQALIRAIPDFGSAMPHKSRLNTLPGAIPLLEQLPIGCRLGPRCPYAQRECIVTPRLTGAKNHLYACHFPLNMEKE